MDSVKTDLFKRHSNYNISVDEIGRKLDFVWAPYVLNLTHLLTDFKTRKKYLDVIVMGAGLWHILSTHMLHVSNPSYYELVLQTLKSSLVSLFPFSTDIANTYGIAEVVVLLVTTTLVTLLIYFSTVLLKVMEGGWIPLVFATFFLTVMYIWHYGGVLKFQSEVREKISMDFMIELGSKLGTVRVPGTFQKISVDFIIELGSKLGTVVKVGLDMVDGEKKATLEAKWMKLQVAQLEAYARQTDFVAEQAKLLLKYYKSEDK
ncbi:hypothetical protein ERO13_D04G098033v2 [Gossypium hirsutum]|nr:hypothetical protein ERO13_D04G098033v2 [Gossypium hirsutum]